MTPKTKWRELLKERRKAISLERREEAARRLAEMFSFSGRILSFISFGTEIDLAPFNQRIQQEGRLFLVPPKSQQKSELSLEGIDCILVPALGFDPTNHRIGYGGGYYDRLLSRAGNILTVGVGFREQWVDELFPKDPWDVPVQKLFLT